MTTQGGCSLKAPNHQHHHQRRAYWALGGSDCDRVQAGGQVDEEAAQVAVQAPPGRRHRVQHHRASLTLRAGQHPLLQVAVGTAQVGARGARHAALACPPSPLHVTLTQLGWQPVQTSGVD